MSRAAAADMLLRKLMFNISTLEDLGRVLSSSEDFRIRLKTALSSIMGSLPVAKGGFFLYHRTDDRDGFIELAAARGVDVSPGIALPLPEAVKAGMLAESRTIFVKSPPEFLREYLENYRIIFNGLMVNILQPLIFKKEFLGFVCLGEKFNGEDYKIPDLELLRIMINYTSIGLHNQTLLVNLEKTNVALRRKIVENSRLYADLQDIYKDTIRALGAAIDAKDPYTRGHSDRVAHFSSAIARRMGLEGDELNAITVASHLHDIGKIAIDNAILCKPMKLSREEFQEVYRHPVVSYDILSNIRFPYRDVALLAKYHHERLNGAGYPDGKKGEDLTTGMKILALADAFDAMTSDRPYRPALSVEEALDEISRNVCVQFDRDVAEAFVNVLRDEVDDGTTAHGIICNMGKRCDPAHLGPVLERTMAVLEGVSSH